MSPLFPLVITTQFAAAAVDALLEILEIRDVTAKKKKKSARLNCPYVVLPTLNARMCVERESYVAVKQEKGHKNNPSSA